MGHINSLIMSGILTITHDSRVPILSWTPRLPYPAAGYQVYWSPGANGPWKGLNQEALLLTEYRDTAHPIRTNNRIYYKVNYLLGAVELPWVTSTLFLRDAEPAWVQRVLSEIKRRHNDIMLGKIGGESCDLYLVRAAGEVCPTGEVVGSGFRCTYEGELCPQCLGTGLLGGYVLMSGEIIRVRNAQEQVELRQDGIVVSEGRRGYMATFPTVHTGDFFVRPNGERYAITNVTSRELQGHRTLQVFNIAIVEPEHPLFNITEAVLLKAAA